MQFFISDDRDYASGPGAPLSRLYACRIVIGYSDHVIKTLRKCVTTFVRRWGVYFFRH